MIFRYKKRLTGGLLLLLVGVAVVWSIFPIVYAVSSSFKPQESIFAYPPRLFDSFTLESYVQLALEWGTFFRGLVNSVIILVGSVVVTLAFGLPSGYAFSRNRTRTTVAAGLAVIIGRMFPPLIITIPLFPLLQSVGLIDRHIVLVLLYAAFYLGIGIWVLKNHIDTIPVELEEAAIIEGASRFYCFLRVIVPLTRPAMVSLSILVAIFSWNEFLFAFLFTSFSAVTAPVVLNEMRGAMFGISWGPLFAATTIQLLPILIFVFAVQRFLIRGITQGASK